MSALALVLLTLAAVAQGMPATGTQVPEKQTAAPVQSSGGAATRKRLTEEEAELSRAREVMQKFAQCLVGSPKRRPEAAAVVLDDIPNSEIVRKHSQLIDGFCLPMRDNTARMKLTLPGDYFRYALAEALITAEVRQPLSDFEAVPLLRHREHDPSIFLPKPGRKQTARLLESLDKSRREDQFEVFVSKFGECVVRLDPANSYRLFTTKPSSAEEAVVFNALQPALARCLAEGKTIKLPMSMARGTIAVNYYRLAKAALGTPRAEAAK